MLVDAPCSGLGVVRRKPEIKYRVLDDNGKELSDRQLRMLEISAGYVRQGGILVYSTCTVNRNENTGVVSRFLKKNRDFELDGSRRLLHLQDEETTGLERGKRDLDGSRL